MKRLLFTLTSLLIFSTLLTAQSASISGKMTERESTEAIISGTIQLFHNGVFKEGTLSDLDGNYFFSNLDPGNYILEFSYLSKKTTRIEDIVVLSGRAMTINIEMEEGAVTLGTAYVTEKALKSLVSPDETTGGGAKTAEEIRASGFRDILGIVSTIQGASSADEGDAVSLRAGRPDGTLFIVDGMPVQGNLIPESDIEQLNVVTSGVEARYGDLSSGFISITTKGPSETFSGAAELETSSFLDAYENNLAGLSLSGPLLKRNGKSVLGYRLSGRYTSRADDDPSAVSVFRVKEEVLADLEANPIIMQNGAPFVAADFLDDEDVNALEQRPYENRSRYDFTGKLDARFSSAIDLTLSGSYSQVDNQFTPNENSATQPSWRLLNAHQNPTNYDKDYRFNFRFRHRLGGQNSDQKGAALSAIQGANYTLQMSYEREQRDLADARHGKNYFDYGYIGRMDVDYIPVFEEALQIDPATGLPIPGTEYLTHVDYREVLRGYDASNSPNPVLANYNNVFDFSQGEILNPDQPNYAIRGGAGDQQTGSVVLDELYAINGRISDIFTNSWGFHANVGSILNSAIQSDDETIIFNANAGFDWLPGGSENGRHNIKFGIVYEQRTNREYFVRDPRQLWTTARQNANSHIQGIDASNADTLGFYTELYDAPELNGQYADAYILSLSLQDDPDAKFYRTLRESLGLGLGEFVNVDGLTPDQLSLDMFSAKELNDQFILDYTGTDYLGNNFDGTFEDFFTARDADGRRTFPVAPNRPIYSAVYLQDKFIYKDIIVNMGVRVDRYDANTKVLKDPYSLYAIQGAGDFHGINDGNRPGNIDDDFKVYTKTDNGEEVQAYRDGDDWFKADGTPVNGPQEIEGIRTGLVFPKYENPAAHEANYIKSENFDPNASFENYEVQVNVMPRIAVSFPISDKANFFAHYDVLVQRPASNTIATPLDYFYFTERTGTETFNNPNLRPTKTVDYEVGFQQRVGTSAAIKIGAYYREMRDMIQLRTFFPVPVVGSYTTFDNQDFGTVKGFSFGYETHRTNHLRFNANYTLQFADGTGSDAESQRGLTNRGNLRTLFPLNNDERHRFNVIADYRYGKEEGPRVSGAYIFANMGLNVQTTAVSGRPYTGKQVAQELGGTGTVGSINGSRKPWNITVNLRLDKNFQISDELGLNIYLRITNLLDRRNIIDVYEVTGSPEEDGFLRSSFGESQQSTIAASSRQLESYIAAYQWRILNPDYFSLPRRMYVGAIMDF